ncbi:MAG: ABC transporter ATP-binding protein [Acidobacteriota bacterium]|nr:ABC transporter ATP-binding protein [Acidobacteriota bacterium]
METAEPHDSATASASECAAALRGVSKMYGSFAALRGVTAEFAAGTSTVVLGENGAGKSTLLRVIAGLVAPTHGSVEVFGGTPAVERRRIAYMSHEAMLYDEMSAMENLEYFAGLHAGAPCGCSASPEMALRAVGLDPGLARPVGQYSQGMRQRASLARVLLTDPELLLLDEPFSNLDTASAQQMVDLLLDFRTWPVPGSDTRGRTIVLTTHQAGLAQPLAERTLTMRAGRVVSSLDSAGATVADLGADPAKDVPAAGA